MYFVRTHDGKIILSGTTCDTMILAHMRDNESGIQTILSEKVNGAPRVTNLSRVFNALTEFYENMK